MDIASLLLKDSDKGSNDYKSGWCDAVCYLNDNFIITKRNGEPITISFDIELDEETLFEKIRQEQERCKKETIIWKLQQCRPIQAVKKLLQMHK